MTTRIKAYGSVIAALFALAFSGRAQGTAFSYQGHLSESGAAASGPHDLIFSLFDGASAGTQIGSSVTNSLPITNGLFNVTLDFGANVFVGDSRWLEISVRRGGSGPFTKLDARMAVLPNPYAIYAATAGKLADNSVAANQLKTSGPPPAAGQFLSYNGASLAWTDPAIASGSLWSKSGADVYYSGGNVGIGGLAATSKLQITGSDALTLIGPGPYLTWYDTTTKRNAAISSGGGTLYYRVPDVAGNILTAGYVDSNGMVTRGRLSVEANGPYITWVDTGSGRSAAISSANGTLYYRVPDAAGNVLTAGYVDSNGSVVRGRLSLEEAGLTGGPFWTDSKWIGSLELGNASAIGWRGNVGGQHFGIGQSTGGLYIFRTANDPGTTGKPANYDVQVTDNGTLQANGALQANGNATQAHDKGGFVKAMAYIRDDTGEILRCYNGVTGISDIVGSQITCRMTGIGLYEVTFPFRVNNRFICLTPQYGPGHSEPNNMGANFRFDQSNPNVVHVFTFDANGGEDTYNLSFMILVF